MHYPGVSNPLRYDSVLVRYLAEELSSRLRGQRIAALRFDPATRVAALEMPGSSLVFALHPTRGHVLLGATPAAETVLPLPRKATLARVEAPADERLLTLDFFGTPADRARRLVIELMTNQWNALALDAEGRILAALWRRDAGGRMLRPGTVYAPPPAGDRMGLEGPVPLDAWRETLADVEPGRRAGRLLACIAYTSPLNAGAILGRASESADAEALDAAHARYAGIAALPPAEPCVLRTDRGPQPYPFPLPGTSYDTADSLLDAMRAVAEAEDVVPAGAVGVPPELVEGLRTRIGRVESRIRRLWQELEGASEEAATLRLSGDLLLARLGSVRKGMEAVELEDFEGGVRTIPLDPALAPVDNANAYYEKARRRDRASERVPPLIEKLESELSRLGALLTRAEAGEAEAAEIEAVVGERDRRESTGGGEEEALPYRRYRTSRGLEVRVGKSSKGNDDLTFHHSAPNDVWLHARDVAGAHVILRWGDAEANPSARDLAEAGTLAALYSRARTSSVVAVDWTRRKYVRKPRKAPPGAVVPDRVKTVFVEPDPQTERRMREAAER